MYAGVIEGIFISPITSVVINGVAINSSTWVQSRFEVTIAMPPSTKKTFTVSLLNGLDPVMVQETLYCEGAEVLPTETGGSIPSTGTNNYNNLLGGIALVMVGSIGVLFRKRIITN
jgi:LPXTG-motif cell wall-anchored protein